MNKPKIKIAEVFSEYPGTRAAKDSDNSAELFYTTILKPVMRKAADIKSRITIDLDGTSGYASSFLDEAFGRLTIDFTGEEIALIDFISTEEPYLIDDIKKSITEWTKYGIHDNSPLKRPRK